VESKKIFLKFQQLNFKHRYGLNDDQIRMNVDKVFAMKKKHRLDKIFDNVTRKFKSSPNSAANDLELRKKLKENAKLSTQLDKASLE
jgi:hypothetical protein